jgi:serine protease Do
MRALLGFLLLVCLPTSAVELPKIKPGDPLPANLFVELAKLINPAVVNISTTYLPHGRQMQDPFFDMLAPFMGPQQFGQQAPQQALGTGFIIREDGLIVTNNHVIDGADVIKVQITEGTKESFDAHLVGKDAKTDIALIKIDAKRKLPSAKLGSSSDVQVGEWVAAFGNPYNYGHTMTKGIISAVGREIDDLNIFPFMQTDASINPGNSGGPLVNTQGQVIGVNTAIDARAQGIGFVIPIDNVKSVLPQLEKDGGIKRGMIGVNMADIDEENARMLNLKQTEGALIVQVFAGSPAAIAGIQPYDLLVEFGTTKIASTHDLSKAVITTPVGTQVPVKIIRNGKPKQLSVKIGGEADMRTAINGGHGTRPEGQKAPFNTGFAVGDYSAAVAQEFNLPKIDQPRPVILSVQQGGLAARAGLAPGDIVLDVNRSGTSHARDVVRGLRQDSLNVLRVLRRDRGLLITIRIP